MPRLYVPYLLDAVSPVNPTKIQFPDVSEGEMVALKSCVVYLESMENISIAGTNWPVNWTITLHRDNVVSTPGALGFLAEFTQSSVSDIFTAIFGQNYCHFAGNETFELSNQFNEVICEREIFMTASFTGVNPLAIDVAIDYEKIKISELRRTIEAYR